MAARAVPALLLLTMACLVYVPLLESGRAPLSPFSDIPAMHLGPKHVLREALAARSIPLWRADQMLGGPALTHPQSLYLHPLHAPFLWLQPARAFGPSFAFALWVGAVGAYVMARVLGVSRASALMAGIAQLVCFKLILACYAGWLSQLATLALLPWLAAAWFAVGRAPRVTSWVGMAFVSTLVFAGGSPQVAFYLSLVLLGYPLVEAYARDREDWLRGWLRRGGLLSTAMIVGLACNAYLWLPIAADLPLMSRVEQSYDFFLSGHGLGIVHLATWLQPELWGSPLDRSYPGVELWEDVAYFGLVPFLFVMGLLLRIRSQPARERYLLVAFAASAAMSLSSPVLRLIHAAVPGYALFRLPGRMLFVTALLGIALFAVALDRVALRLGGWSRTTTRVAAACLALLMVGEGAFYARTYLTTEQAERLEPSPHHPARGLSREGGRAAVVGRGTLNYGWAKSLGLELLNGYDPYMFKHVRDYVVLIERGSVDGHGTGVWLDLSRITRTDLLRELSVGYVLSRRPLADPSLRLVSQHGGVRNFALYKGERSSDLFIYAVQDALPRARWAGRPIIVPTQADMMRGLADPEKTADQVFVLRGPKRGEPGRAFATDRVEELARASGSVDLRVEAQQSRLLVLAEAFHPGWEVRVDGAHTSVLQANLALIGAWIPPGVHRVEARFRPRHFMLALWISALGASVLLGGALVAWRERRKAQRAVVQEGLVHLESG